MCLDGLNNNKYMNNTVYSLFDVESGFLPLKF